MESRIGRRAALRRGANLLGGGALAAVLGRAGRRLNFVSAQNATPGVLASPRACASPIASSAEASPAEAIEVRMTNQLRFEPETLTIRAGQTVTWINASAIPHTTTDDPAANPVAKSHPDYALLPAGAAPWNSGLLQPGERFDHAFDVPGEYRYFCIPHVLSGMRGTIAVAY